MVNVSLGGCWIRTDALLSPGSSISLHLCEPGLPFLMLEASVLRASGSDLCVRFTRATREALVPLLFARRHGARGLAWLKGPELPLRAPTTVYLIGLPSRIAAARLKALLAPYGVVEGATISRLPEGPVATLHTPHVSAVESLIEGLNGRTFLGGTVLLIRAQSLAGYVLRMVLQATAEARFSLNHPAR